MIGKQTIESIARAIATPLRAGAENLFGPFIRKRVVGEIAWADLLVFAVFLLAALFLQAILTGFLRRKLRDKRANEPEEDWQYALWHSLGKPLVLLIWITAAYFALMPLLLRYGALGQLGPVRVVIDSAFDLGIVSAMVWAAFRFTRVIEALLAKYARRTAGKFDDLLVPLVGKTLRVIIPVLGVILGLPLIGLSAESSEVVRKLSGLLIIGCVAWILFQAVGLLEKFVLGKYDITAANNLEARKIHTQVHVLSRTLYVLISIFAIASMLMMFEEVRRLGTSILASAGVVGIIIGFAAQRTIANLFAGFQLAITQPIRIDDVVIVEGEWGRVEEITLTYVVIKIWDQRRLIVPLSHFIEKPFQNWTRVSSDILGSVFLYADYTVPLDAIRQEAKRLIENHPDWDKRFWNVQVTDATERSMQIRVLATAADSGKAFNLRCHVREHLIGFIQKHHGGSLPKVRAEFLRNGEPEAHAAA